MKSIKRITILAIILGVFTTLSGCKKDKDSPSEEAIQLGKLSDTWALTSVTKDDVEFPGYVDFTLTLSGSAAPFSYAVSGRPEVSPWLASGIWNFGSTISSQLVRDGNTDDELLINYSLTDTTLELEFDFSGEGYSAGRVQSPEGHWIFTFSRQ